MPTAADETGLELLGKTSDIGRLAHWLTDSVTHRLARSESQKNFERNRLASPKRIEDIRFGVEGNVGAQADLAGRIVQQVAHSAQGKRTDAETAIKRRRRRRRQIGEELVFIHQLEAQEKIIARLEVEHRFQQIAVLIACRQNFVIASPEQSRVEVAGNLR